LHKLEARTRDAERASFEVGALSRDARRDTRAVGCARKKNFASRELAARVCAATK
jgi:hypothetical protein